MTDPTLDLKTKLSAIHTMQRDTHNSIALGSSFLMSCCSKVPGVGTKLLERLKQLNITCLQDLLWHLPRDFEDRRFITPVDQLRSAIGEKKQLELKVHHSQVRQGKIPRLLIYCSDADLNSEQICLVFFKPQRHQIQQWQQQTRARVFGEISLFDNSGEQMLQMTHPDTVFMGQDPLPLVQTLTPIYPTAQGIYQKQWRTWLAWLFNQLEAAPFSIDALQDAGLATTEPDLLQAFKAIHHGKHIEVVDQAHAINRQCAEFSRLALEELVIHQLSWRPKQSASSAVCIELDKQCINAILKRLPFTMTKAQQRCFNEIAHDLAQPKPMSRLLQGDVGSGKTLVAALAAALTINQGHQVAILAPTEILAKQHFEAFQQFLPEYFSSIQLLTGKLKARDRAVILETIASGQIKIIIGTHALFQKDVVYKNLHLVIIDEQHRFGVEQRQRLIDKGLNRTQNQVGLPHQLMMTATPIPRTLTMSVYAQLDTSIIDELPAHRKPVITAAIAEHQRDQLYKRVVSFLESGQQGFWVCAIISETENSGEKKSIETTHEILSYAMPEIKIGVMHGQLTDKEKQQALTDFIERKTQLLLATSMVEVGVNIPNASLMIVENAQHWGLTQLHQLRGRVGRGDQTGYMLLLHQSPLNPIAHERLTILRETTDGFKIAEKDLDIRGPGHISGLLQSGHNQFKVADLNQDAALFPIAKSISDQLIQLKSEYAHHLVERYFYSANKNLTT